MTFFETFYAEQLFLSKAKNVLDNPISFDEDCGLEERTVAILCCSFALEALTNSLFLQLDNHDNFDTLTIREKLITISERNGLIVNFGSDPWQHLTKLITVRNWLVHYKEPSVGLLGAENKYVRDISNIPPKLAPRHSLDRLFLEKSYKSVREAIYQISSAMQLVDDYGYLKTEKYYPLMIG